MKRQLTLLLVTIILSACDPSPTIKRTSTTTGIKDNQIILGTSSALDGHASFLGIEYLQGANLVFSEVNNTGGIFGRQILIVSHDDGYNPVKTITNTQKLLFDDKVFALFNYVGTPTSVAAKPIINSAGIPAVGFFTGAEAMRNPLSPYIFHIRDSYYAEAEGIIRYYTDILGLKKIGVLYQEDTFGIAVLSGVQLALQKRGLTPFVTDTFKRGSMDTDDGLDRISKAKVEAIVMVGTYSPLAKFIKQFHNIGQTPLFATVSFIGSEAFARELIHTQKIDPKEYGKILVSQVVPSPDIASIKAAAQYQELSHKYHPDKELNYVAFEGFLNAKVIVHALEKSGEKISRETFINALESIKSFDLGLGKNLSYNKKNHEGLSGVYLSRLIDDGTFDTFDTSTTINMGQ